MSNCPQLCPQLPSWVSYLQALAVPIIAALVAAFGTWIAARQMLIAYDKLQHDAFDRQYDKRVVIYEATRKFLADVFLGNISEAEIRAYGLYTLDARFLFDDNLYKYLREICSRVATWNDAKSSLENLPSGAEQDIFKEIKTKNLNWIIQQGDEHAGFSVKFAPFLVYKEIKRSWWLRWPSKR